MITHEQLAKRTKDWEELQELARPSLPRSQRNWVKSEVEGVQGLLKQLSGLFPPSATNELLLGCDATFEHNLKDYREMCRFVVKTCLKALTDKIKQSGMNLDPDLRERWAELAVEYDSFKKTELDANPPEPDALRGKLNVLLEKIDAVWEKFFPPPGTTFEAMAEEEGSLGAHLVRVGDASISRRSVARYQL